MEEIQNRKNYKSYQLEIDKHLISEEDYITFINYVHII